MRLISWNCHDGFAKKAPALLALKPDIAMISEVRARDLERFKENCSIVFAGESSKKGVAVLGWNGWTLEQSAPVTSHWFLPVVAKRGSDHIHILAVWVKPTTNYVAPTLRQLAIQRNFLANDKSIVVGDFNQNIRFDKGRLGHRRFAAALEGFAEYGLSSVWHQTKGEMHGEESASSLFFRYNETKGYHIDYAFLSPLLMRGVSDVSLGSFDDWVRTRLSDHVPLSVTFDLSLCQ